MGLGPWRITTHGYLGAPSGTWDLGSQELESQKQGKTNPGNGVSWLQGTKAAVPG